MAEKQTLEQWEINSLVDDKIKGASKDHDQKMKDYDVAIKEFVKTQFTIKLATVNVWISVTKFIAIAVALLVIGTLYQLFISLVNSTGIK